MWVSVNFTGKSQMTIIRSGCQFKLSIKIKKKTFIVASGIKWMTCQGPFGI